MKAKGAVLTRRDFCYLPGRRGQRLKPKEATGAWMQLSRQIEAMGELDIPKFSDLLRAYHAAAIIAHGIKPRSRTGPTPVKPGEKRPKKG